MNRKLLSFFAGIGILSLIFIVYGSIDNSKATMSSTLDFLEVGKTYNISVVVREGNIKILEKQKGEWVKVSFNRGSGFDTNTGYMNINTFAFIETK